MIEENQEADELGPSAKSLYCGVDVGDSATKLVILDVAGEVRSRLVRASGVDYSATARACVTRALSETGAREEQLVRTVATGYGRHNVRFADASLTEIHCHGIGCYHALPRAMTIVDIGGQDNKVIRLDDSGRRVDFSMNRKCAAGTGAFIEEIANRLEVDLAEMDALARSTSEAVRLSSFCTVFAKTEILAHLRQGAQVAGIVRGAFQSVINRVLEMDSLSGEVVLSGGVVAYNPSVADILSERLGRSVKVAPHPQFTGALGAALTAAKQAKEEQNA
jgi:predicted CoA-substrate-specific enzyme activase